MYSITQAATQKQQFVLQNMSDQFCLKVFPLFPFEEKMEKSMNISLDPCFSKC